MAATGRRRSRTRAGSGGIGPRFTARRLRGRGAHVRLPLASLAGGARGHRRGRWLTRRYRRPDAPIRGCSSGEVGAAKHRAAHPRSTTHAGAAGGSRYRPVRHFPLEVWPKNEQPIVSNHDLDPPGLRCAGSRRRTPRPGGFVTIRPPSGHREARFFACSSLNLRSDLDTVAHQGGGSRHRNCEGGTS